MGAPLIFLGSKEASYINGCNFITDAGFTASMATGQIDLQYRITLPGQAPRHFRHHAPGFVHLFGKWLQVQHRTAQLALRRMMQTETATGGSGEKERLRRGGHSGRARRIRPPWRRRTPPDCLPRQMYRR